MRCGARARCTARPAHRRRPGRQPRHGVPPRRRPGQLPSGRVRVFAQPRSRLHSGRTPSARLSNTTTTPNATSAAVIGERGSARVAAGCPHVPPYTAAPSRVPPSLGCSTSPTGGAAEPRPSPTDCPTPGCGCPGGPGSGGRSVAGSTPDRAAAVTLRSRSRLWILLSVERPSASCASATRCSKCVTNPGEMLTGWQDALRYRRSASMNGSSTHQERNRRSADATGSELDLVEIAACVRTCQIATTTAMPAIIGDPTPSSTVVNRAPQSHENWMYPEALSQAPAVHRYTIPCRHVKSHTPAIPRHPPTDVGCWRRSSVNVQQRHRTTPRADLAGHPMERFLGCSVALGAGHRA